MTKPNHMDKPLIVAGLLDLWDKILWSNIPSADELRRREEFKDCPPGYIPHRERTWAQVKRDLRRGR